MEAAISLVYEALGDNAKGLYICSGKYLMMEEIDTFEIPLTTAENCEKHRVVEHLSSRHWQGNINTQIKVLKQQLYKKKNANTYMLLAKGHRTN